MKKYLIVLSGWAIDKFVWRPICDLLSKDFEIIIIDWDNVASVDDFKQKVITLLNEKGIKKFSIIGWSLGSLVAIDIATSYSSQIDNIILFSATSRFTQDEIGNYHMGWNKKIVERMIYILKIHPEETLKNFYKNLFTDLEVNHGYYEIFLKEVSNLNKKYNVGSLSLGLEYLILKDFRENIKNLNISVLLIHGDSDLICPLKAGRYLKKFFEKSKLIILNQTGHMPFFTKANQCYEIIKNHILSKEGR
jgi:pimeloyl-[acyl-carrier protein] methyl ester esterase